MSAFILHKKRHILLNNEPTEDYHAHEVRRLMSIVAQDNILFDTRISENIHYGNLSNKERVLLMKSSSLFAKNQTHGNLYKIFQES